jgi:hypothetical protein
VTRAALAVILVLVFFLSGLFCLPLPELARANPSPGPISLSIHSPSSQGENSNIVLLNVSIIVYRDSLEGSENRWIAYSLDNQNNKTITPHYEGVITEVGFPFSVVTAIATLRVPEGLHNITVYAKYNYGGWISEGSKSVEFIAGTPEGPNPNSISAGLAIIAAVSIGSVVVYLKKSKREADNP